MRRSTNSEIPKEPPGFLETVVRVSSLSFPSSSAELFGRDAPLVMEIGVGSGGFIAALAAENPRLNVLGVDRAPQSIARSYRRLRSLPDANARLIKADARFVVRNVLPPSGLQRIYVNYPDPWPRKKHHHRRLLHASFLRMLASRMSIDAQLLVTTDHPDYFEFVLENAKASNVFRLDVREAPPEVLETKWARKGEAHHHAALTRIGPVEDYDVDAELTDHLRPSVASEFESQGSEDEIEGMYHAVLKGPLPDVSDLKRRSFKHHDGVAVAVDSYRLIDGRGYAFLMHVEENNLTQEVIVEAREGRNGIVVALKRFGEPLHTPGVAAAVRSIVEWLEENGMSTTHRKY